VQAQHLSVVQSRILQSAQADMCKAHPHLQTEWVNYVHEYMRKTDLPSAPNKNQWLLKKLKEINPPMLGRVFPASVCK
jgi:hypothetical protein